MYTLKVNGEISLTFTKGKKYDLGTGYIALLQEGYNCFLCRYLGENEEEWVFPEGKPHVLHEVNNKSSKQTAGKMVFIISSSLSDIAEADVIIKSYKKVFDTLFYKVKL